MYDTQGEHSGHRYATIGKNRLVRERERQLITGVSKPSWYRLQKVGKAPLPVTLGPKQVAWIERELLEWVNERIAERNEKAV